MTRPPVAAWFLIVAATRPVPHARAGHRGDRRSGGRGELGADARGELGAAERLADQLDTGAQAAVLQQHRAGIAGGEQHPQPWHQRAAASARSRPLMPPGSTTSVSSRSGRAPPCNSPSPPDRRRPRSPRSPGRRASPRCARAPARCPRPAGWSRCRAPPRARAPAPARPPRRRSRGRYRRTMVPWPGFAVDHHVAGGLLGEPVDHRQPEAGALARAAWW